MVTETNKAISYTEAVDMAARVAAFIGSPLGVPVIVTAEQVIDAYEKRGSTIERYVSEGDSVEAALTSVIAEMRERQE